MAELSFNPSIPRILVPQGTSSSQDFLGPAFFTMVLIPENSLFVVTNGAIVPDPANYYVFEGGYVQSDGSQVHVVSFDTSQTGLPAWISVPLIHNQFIIPPFATPVLWLVKVGSPDPLPEMSISYGLTL